MVIMRKAKIEEPIEILRIAKELKKQAALRSLLYLDPVTARSMFAAELRDKLSMALKERAVFRKMERLCNTAVGRAYINNIVISSAKKYIREGEELVSFEGFGEIPIPVHNRYSLKILREELSRLYANRDVKGSNYIKEVRNIIYRIFDSKTAQKIERELFTHISMVELGKKGLLDPIDARAFLRSKDNKPIGFKVYDVNQIGEARKELGIRWRKSDYFEIKIAKILLEVITTSSSPEEVRRKFVELYIKEREKDPLFKQSEIKGAFKYLQEMYSASALWSGSEKILTEIPTRLVSLAARMIANAYRMLPLVGAIAAVNAEAAAAIAELGEGLKDKVEQSGRTYFNLKNLLGEKKAEEIEKIIESSLLTHKHTS